MNAKRLSVMLDVVSRKFEQKDEGAFLLQTHPKELVECNHLGGILWGVVERSGV